MIETVISTPPAGAGRSLDLMWPGLLDTLGVNGTAVSNAVNMVGRPGGVSLGAQFQTVSGVGSAIAYATGTGFNGRGAVQLIPGTGGANTGAKVQLTWGLNPSLGGASVNGYLNSALTDPYACYRLVSLLSFGANNNTAVTNETGWVYSAHNVGDHTIRPGGACGFGFIQTAADTVSFVRRAGVSGAGGVVTVVPVIQSSAAGILNWHCYEIRIIGATSAQNAQLKAFVDGQQVNLQGVNGPALDWIADSLPTPLASNGVYGFQCAFHGRGPGVGASGLAIYRTFYQTAPVEAALV